MKEITGPHLRWFYHLILKVKCIFSSISRTHDIIARSRCLAYRRKKYTRALLSYRFYSNMRKRVEIIDEKWQVPNIYKYGISLFHYTYPSYFLRSMMSSAPLVKMCYVKWSTRMTQRKKISHKQLLVNIYGFLSISVFQMGKTFLQHPGGVRLYSCAKCDTVLTNKSQLISMVSQKWEVIDWFVYYHTLLHFMNSGRNTWENKRCGMPICTSDQYRLYAHIFLCSLTRITPVTPSGLQPLCNWNLYLCILFLCRGLPEPQEEHSSLIKCKWKNKVAK